MKDCILSFFLVSLFTIFVYASVMQGKASGQEKIKFPTQNIREMWYSCSIEFRKLMPYMQETTRIYLCDCYTDHMRKSFTPEQVKNLTPSQSRILGLEMRNKCPIPNPFPQPKAPPLTLENST